MRLTQRAKKVVSDSPGLVDFAIGLVNSVINLPDGQVNFFEEFKLQKNFEINLLIKTFLGLVEMIFGLLNVSFSLCEWQAVKITFFVPCYMLYACLNEVLAFLFSSHRLLCLGSKNVLSWSKPYYMQHSAMSLTRVNHSLIIKVSFPILAFCLIGFFAVELRNTEEYHCIQSLSIL